MTEDDHLHLATAHGFSKRKEWLEAHAALERMSPDLRTAPEVLALKVQIFHGLGNWEMMEIVARTLANGLPDETHWMVTWVVAKRHLNGDEVADAILADYLPALPAHGKTHYALGKLSRSFGCGLWKIPSLTPSGMAWEVAHQRFEIAGRSPRHHTQ